VDMVSHFDVDERGTERVFAGHPRIRCEPEKVRRVMLIYCRGYYYSAAQTAQKQAINQENLQLAASGPFAGSSVPRTRTDVADQNSFSRWERTMFGELSERGREPVGGEGRKVCVCVVCVCVPG
jgi:hypothetical protein